MFTEGLDESAINWIKRGSDVEEEAQARVRSPLSPLSTEQLSPPIADLFPKSPLFHNSSSHLLPPLKFQSGLLTPHSIISPCLKNREDDEDNESVASVSEYVSGRGNYTEEDDFEDEAVVSPTDFDYLEKPVMQSYHDLEEEEEISGVTSSSSSRPTKTKVNRGFLKEDLKIELPGHFRRLKTTTGGDLLGYRKFSTTKKNSVGLGGGISLRERVQLRNALEGHSSNEVNGVKPSEDMGTPSAPPVMEIEGEEEIFTVETEPEHIADAVCKLSGSGSSVGGQDVTTGRNRGVDPTSQCVQTTECHERIKKSTTEEKMPYWQTSLSDHLPSYNTGAQYAWQTMIAYDACIRLCLNAWDRGRSEAPEFLRDECLILRSAFGLHKFLLQPRGIQPREVKTTKSTEQICQFKVKKVAGKIRVEVRKLRTIPRQKLKSSYSQHSALYIQMGKEYVQHVSSMVKTGIKSFKLASFPVATEEKLSCLFQLKSSTEKSEVEPGSAICLHPGSGDYHIFFPESEGDALLVEVQDTKKAIQGRATIAISSLNDNLSGPVGETLAYDLLQEAAMRAQHFHSQSLRLRGSWKWLLIEFADYYSVSDSYTKLRYLSRIMDVAIPIKDCLELVIELLVPIIKARSEKSLTVQEKSIFLDCETRIESLLAQVFENYKSLDESSPTGLSELINPVQKIVAPALAQAVKGYTLLHDILSRDAQTILRNYLQVQWAGVTTNHSTSPFAEEIYEKIKDSLTEYEVVISRWPRYSLILENAVADVERAIVKGLEKQHIDILTPLKDSIPKRLNMHVQKLARRPIDSSLFCTSSIRNFFEHHQENS